MFRTDSLVRMVVLFLPTCITLKTVTNENSDWTTTCNFQQKLCDCKIWTNGLKVVECTNSSFTSIPENMNVETQVVDLSNNAIAELKKDVFSLAGLTKLEVLIARNCSISLVDKDSFRDLKILTKLDLSNNNIHELLLDTFQHTLCLREIILNGNPMQRLQTGLFGSMKSLQVVKLGWCQISQIELKVFNDNITKLDLDLIGNRLTNIDPNVFSSIYKFLHLDIRNNPWRCDCNLKPFKLMLEKKHINYTQTVSCTEPSSMMNKSWSDINSDEFICSPPKIQNFTSYCGGEMDFSTSITDDLNNNVFIKLSYGLFVILVFVTISLTVIISFVILVFCLALCICETFTNKGCCDKGYR